MYKYIFLLLLFCGFSSAQQCTKAPDGGTYCTSPLHLVPQQGQSPITIRSLTPANSQWQCPANLATPISWIECPQNGVITVDYGDGRGFVPAVGPAGKDGKDGTNGTNGTNGIQGIQGPPGNIALPATLTLTCARGHGTVITGYTAVCTLSK